MLLMVPLLAPTLALPAAFLTSGESAQTGGRG
jgi:hypothetical protein